MTDSNLVPTTKGTPDDDLKRPRVRWGVKHFFYAMLALLGSQGIFTLIVGAIYVARQPTEAIMDPQAVENLTTGLLNFMISGPMIFASSLLMYLSWGAVVWFASARRGYNSFLKDYWMKFKWRRDILIAIGVTLLLRVLELVVANGLNWLGVDMRGASNGAFLLEQPTIWFVLNALLVACFLAPLFEELLFRGLLLQGLLRLGQKMKHRERGQFASGLLRFLGKHKNTLAVFLSSVMFGMMHFQGTEYFGHLFVILWTTFVGLVMALIVLKTKRLGPAILAHIFYNTSGVVLMVLTVGMSAGAGV